MNRTVILYSNVDMEPITALNLPFDYQKVASERVLRLPIIPPVSCTPPTGCPPKNDMWIVELWAGRFTRRGKEHLFFFTDDEFALLLQSEWLAGQRKELQQATQAAFDRGLTQGLFSGW